MRDRILAAAGEVFANEGLRAGGMDRIAARAGVTKRTIYYHFRSKDDLISAFLAEGDDAGCERLLGWMTSPRTSMRDGMGQIIHRIAQASAEPRWRGCGFLRAAFEFAELPGHPARIMAAAHKRQLEAWMARRIATEGLQDAEGRARSLMLVLDGLIAQLVVHRDIRYAAQALSMVQMVLSPDGAGAALPKAATVTPTAPTMRREVHRPVNCSEPMAAANRMASEDP
ncbi:TetR/AcrR family transcriptional regulator [Roseomonas sp. ROY-5-3]|uniref:TetR/AcrR family transcriptional regulator n=2 Tax=Acetobacterales TaxID=3120395 RepID=A0ABS6HFN5_9PROT|nr:TetR/AcrR family transcriptional regulator [Roseomonas oleicola]